MRHFTFAFALALIRRLGWRPRLRPRAAGRARSKWRNEQRLERSKHPARSAPVLSRQRHGGRPAQAAAAGVRRRGPFKQSDFSIGHRGAALQFPEHTRSPTRRRARMGAGILECDVTFTKDKRAGLPARAERPAHDHQHPRRRRWPPSAPSRSRRPIFDADGKLITPASAECRTSDITLAEFKTLTRQDGRVQPARADAAGVPRRHGELPHRPLRRPDQRPPADPQGEHRAVQEARREDDARAQDAERGDAVQRLHAGGLRAEDDRRVQGGRRARRAACSRSRSTRTTCCTGSSTSRRSAGRRSTSTTPNVVADLPGFAELAGYKAQGINIVGAADLRAAGARRQRTTSCRRSTRTDAKAAGLDIITWTLERSGILADGNNGFYYQTFDSGHQARRRHDAGCSTCWPAQVGILGIFSDWPATVTYYANCMNIR